jgi:fructose 1,6-bisphosphate aldolase/phosphatase
MSENVTTSVIKADVGGFVGHSAMHPDPVKTAEDGLSVAVEKTHVPIFM